LNSNRLAFPLFAAILQLMKTLLSILLITATFSVQSAIQTQVVEYKQGDTVLEGYLVYSDNVNWTRPAVLVVHQWTGITDYERKRCQQLADLGYVAFAADIYGKGIRPTNITAAAEESGKYKSNRELLRQRVNAALEVLRKRTTVDTNRIAAIGYCFGGTAAIELARSGANIAGVVSFHGGLDSPRSDDGNNIRCRILACHGADDPFVSSGDLAAFENEMRSANVDWRLIKYGGAVHSFTQPEADGSMKGAQYNERADKRSWEDMKLFFDEIFKGVKSLNR
jgi:dienelactone hydrolase